MEEGGGRHGGGGGELAIRAYRGTRFRWKKLRLRVRSLGKVWSWRKTTSKEYGPGGPVRNSCFGPSATTVCLKEAKENPQVCNVCMPKIKSRSIAVKHRNTSTDQVAISTNVDGNRPSELAAKP